MLSEGGVESQKKKNVEMELPGTAIPGDEFHEETHLGEAKVPEEIHNGVRLAVMRIHKNLGHPSASPRTWERCRWRLPCAGGHLAAGGRGPLKISCQTALLRNMPSSPRHLCRANQEQKRHLPKRLKQCGFEKNWLEPKSLPFVFVSRPGLGECAQKIRNLGTP